MSVDRIINAASMTIERGTEDFPGPQVPREPELVPQHCPKFYTFAPKGPLEPRLVSGADLLNLYGDDVLNLRSKYTTHATPFIEGCNGMANLMMVQRVLGEGALPEATLVVWADVLPTQVDTYERNSDGSIRLNATTGDPIITGHVAGYKVKLVTGQNSDPLAFGALTQMTGDQIDTLTGTTSTRYPLFEMKVSSIGEYGNNRGIRLWPLTRAAGSMPEAMMKEYKAYPYMMSMIARDNASATPTVTKTLFNEISVMVTFKDDVYDPDTTKDISMSTSLLDSYRNLTDLRYPVVDGDFSKLHIYQNNLNTLLEQFHAAEVPFLADYSNYDNIEPDFSANPEDAGLFNFVTGIDSNGVPYQSFVMVDAPNSTRFTANTNVYAGGSSDGQLGNAAFDAAVSREVLRYRDANDEVQELAYHVESVMYDSGFSLQTKYDLAAFISVRKDTIVRLGTFVAGGKRLTESEEHALAVALRSRIRYYPESEYFGTEACRGAIYGRSALIRNSLYKDRVPATYEVMMKFAKYMGSANGKWKNNAHFDGAPGSIIEYLYDFNITWVPKSVRNRLWDAGLNWVMRYDRSSFYFPAYRTVFANDSSVLQDEITVSAVAELNKVANAVHREFSGTSRLTDPVLVRDVNESVNRRVKDRFDGRFTIIPQATINEMDSLRGYSWSLPIRIEADKGKTVMTTWVQSVRRIAQAAA